MSTIPKFTEEELNAAKSKRDDIIAYGTTRQKADYMAGEIVMWDEMRQLATDGREELEKEIGYWQENQKEWRDDNNRLKSSLKEKEKECEELKTSGWKEGYIKQSKQIEELKAENERLKGLVKTQFFKYYDDAFQEHIWEEYAKENNL